MVLDAFILMIRAALILINTFLICEPDAKMHPNNYKEINKCSSTWIDIHAHRSYMFCTLQDEWTVNLYDSPLISTNHPSKWVFVKENAFSHTIKARLQNDVNFFKKGYAFGHLGDSSSQIDLVSIQPRPGKKSDR